MRPAMARAERGCRFLGKAVAGEGGDDDIEAVLWVAAAAFRVGEALDDIEEGDEGVGPAVEQEERLGRASRARLVDEVHRLTLDLGLEVAKTIDRPLLRPPVVVVQPVLGQRLQEGEIDAVVPAGSGWGVGPGGGADAARDLLQGGLGDIDGEGGGLRCLH